MHRRTRDASGNLHYYYPGDAGPPCILNPCITTIHGLGMQGASCTSRQGYPIIPMGGRLMPNLEEEEGEDVGEGEGEVQVQDLEFFSFS